MIAYARMENLRQRTFIRNLREFCNDLLMGKVSGFELLLDYLDLQLLGNLVLVENERSRGHIDGLAFRRTPMTDVTS